MMIPAVSCMVDFADLLGLVLGALVSLAVVSVAEDAVLHLADLFGLRFALSHALAYVAECFESWCCRHLERGVV